MSGLVYKYWCPNIVRWVFLDPFVALFAQLSPKFAAFCLILFIHKISVKLSQFCIFSKTSCATAVLLDWQLIAQSPVSSAIAMWGLREGNVCGLGVLVEFETLNPPRRWFTRWHGKIVTNWHRPRPAVNWAPRSYSSLASHLDGQRMSPMRY